MRLSNWEARLSAYLAEVLDRPYRYGSHDCLLHVANAALAMTGVDPGAGHRGKYRTEAGAARHLRRHGADSPAAMMDQRFERIPPAFAQRGDAVAGDDGIPGVCIGARAAFVGEDGLAFTPIAEWRFAWKVAR